MSTNRQNLNQPGGASLGRSAARSRSASPASSVDSTSRRRSLGKKKGAAKIREDVQVFTSLPPKVEGEIKSFLLLQISRVNWTQDMQLGPASGAGARTSVASRTKSKPAEVQELQTAFLNSVMARCLWWGEEDGGSIFRPRVTFGTSIESSRKCQTTAKYVVRSGLKQFSSYLNDMKTLKIEIINEKTMETLGRAHVHELGQLSPSSAIKGYFPVFNLHQIKIAEIWVSMRLESARDSMDSVASKRLNESLLMNGLASDHSRPVTPSSAANLNDFSRKYDEFEKRQKQTFLLSGGQNFNSDMYATTAAENDEYRASANATAAAAASNPILSHLIEKGHKLRSEMIKSTHRAASPATDSPLVSKTTAFLSSIVNPPKPALADTDVNFSFFSDYDPANEVTRLSDPLNDPQMLSALLYDKQTSLLAGETGSFEPLDAAKKENGSLETLKRLNGIGEMNEFNQAHSLRRGKSPAPLPQASRSSLRRRSLSRSSMSSTGSLTNDDDFGVGERENIGRVSFELQSSDGESSATGLGEKCVDVLSPQRLSLLNLVQVAKLNIKKVLFFNSTNVNIILDRIGKIEHDSLAQTSSLSDTTSKRPKSSTSKPPKAVKKLTSEPNSLFFIEYQFPVVANSRHLLMDSAAETANLDTSILESPIMATQVMRVAAKAPKRTGAASESLGLRATAEEAIDFEHQSEYAVLFNSQSLESWWRSVVVFKIYCRSPTAASQPAGQPLNSSNPSAKVSTAPYLVGTARLQLRNVLKSRNFKLLKKLTVVDQLGAYEGGGSVARAKKRIGTLLVSIEFSSDLKEFYSDLNKLKSHESRRQTAAALKNRSPSPSAGNRNNNSSSASRTTEDRGRQKPPSPPHRPEPLGHVSRLAQTGQPFPVHHNYPIDTKLSTTTAFERAQTTSAFSRVNSQPEPSLPIQMYLSINEGRGFDYPNSANLNMNQNINLVCRLFWCKEKVKFEANNFMSFERLGWTLNQSFMIKPSTIDNMRNNFMIIEVWQKAGAFSGQSNESLIGTVKIPLNEFYLSFRNFDALRESLRDRGAQPLIGVNGWLASCDPFTGNKTGEINVVLAMGSNEQVLNLQKYLFDQARMGPAESAARRALADDCLNNEHVLTFEVDSVRLQQSRAGSAEPFATRGLLEENHLFVRYLFPVGDHGGLLMHAHCIAARSNRSFESRQEHWIRLNKMKSLESELVQSFAAAAAGHGDPGASAVHFEVWSRSYTPYLKEKLVAKGELPLICLFQLTRGQKGPSAFAVQLIAADEAHSRTEHVIDRFIGQLNLSVTYRLNPGVAELPAAPQLVSRVENDCPAAPCGLNSVCLNVGVLRAVQTHSMLKNAASKARIDSFNLDKSEVYVKFSLEFLNRPEETRRTRCLPVQQSNFAPEFFDYFELVCPLTAKYLYEKRRPVSLAEQIENGRIVFEVWTKVATNAAKQDKIDVFAGVCVVPLDSLLDNRVGIKGLQPVRPTESLSAAVAPQGSIGALEVAIRFSRHDDYLTVIDAAGQIGWQSAKHEQTKMSAEKQPVAEAMRLDIEAIRGPANSPMSSVAGREPAALPRLKCLVEIERAVRLPMVSDERTGKQALPSAFVAFNTSLGVKAESLQTPTCERQSAPVWNYQHVLEMSGEYFLDEGKFFILKVWHRVAGEASAKLLGHASVDVTPLVCGLSHISGWYNINDSVCNCHGQLKVTIVPQESLAALKQLHMERKKRDLSLASASDRNRGLSTYSSRFENSSVFDLRGLTLTAPAVATPAPVTPPPSLSNTTCLSSTASAPKPAPVEEPVDLKTGLFQKLSELEQLTRSLAERLGHEEAAKKPKNAANKSEPPRGLLTRRPEPPVVPVILAPEAASKKSSATSCASAAAVANDDPLKEILLMKAKAMSLIDKSNNLLELGGRETTPREAPVPATCDSFWASSVVLDKSVLVENITGLSAHQEVEGESGGSEQRNDEADEMVEQLILDQKLEGYLNDEAAPEAEPENENDRTELDQTMNFQASYEAAERRFVPDPEQKRVIDCTKLDEDEPNEAAREDEAEEAAGFTGFNPPPEESEDDENVTVIVPEEINRIAEEDDDSEPAEAKINQSTSGQHLPNYFLPQEDLEISMRRLHYNYTEVAVGETTPCGAALTSPRLEEAARPSGASTKSLVIRNESALKQDLGRINKIFHSKQKPA